MSNTSNSTQSALKWFIEETTDIPIANDSETRNLILSKLSNQDLLETLLESNVIGCIRGKPDGTWALQTMLQDLKEKAEEYTSNSTKCALKWFIEETTDIPIANGSETRNLILSKLSNQDLLETLLESNVIGCIRGEPDGTWALQTMLQDLKEKAEE